MIIAIGGRDSITERMNMAYVFGHGTYVHKFAVMGIINDHQWVFSGR